MKAFVILVFLLFSVSSMQVIADGIDIVFINGIQNEPKEADKSSRELSRAIGQPSNRVKAVYNHTNGFFEDIAETYAYAKMDGTNGGKDFTKFWQLVNGDFASANRRGYGNNEPMPEHLKQWYINQIVDGFHKYQGDYLVVYNEIKRIRSANSKPNKKLLILSHSEGTVVANLVMMRLLEEYGDAAKQCTRLVSVATPVSTAVGIRNGGRYTTSNKDAVIGGIRADISSMPSNINTGYDPDNDFLGHSLVDIYLNRGKFSYQNHENVRNKIISDINAMADEINEECVAYDTWVTSSYNFGTFFNLENDETAYVNFYVEQVKDGEVYNTINLGNILAFRLDTSESGHETSSGLNGLKHYHVSCGSSVYGLCTYLRRHVYSDYIRGSDGNNWTISAFGSIDRDNFIGRIRHALRERYKHD